MNNANDQSISNQCMTLPQSVRKVLEGQDQGQFVPATSSFCSVTASQGVIGLQNQGNTCFAAAALQCLLSLSHVVRLFGGDPSRAPVPLTGMVGQEFACLVQAAWRSHHGTIYSVERCVGVKRTRTCNEKPALPGLSAGFVILMQT